jgi:hypothetical protein
MREKRKLNDIIEFGIQFKHLTDLIVKFSCSSRNKVFNTQKEAEFFDNQFKKIIDLMDKCKSNCENHFLKDLDKAVEQKLIDRWNDVFYGERQDIDKYLKMLSKNE